MRRHRLRPVRPLLLCVLFLAGCGPEIRTITEIRVPSVPTELRHCEPAAPIPDQPVSDTALASWVLADRRAGEDCRSRLGSVDLLLNAFEAEQKQIMGNQNKASP